MKFPYTVDGGTFEDDLFESVSAEAFYGAMAQGRRALDGPGDAADAH